MNFEFNDWRITTPISLAHQYDNLTRQIVVEGDIPAGWTWTMLVRCGSNKDAITLAQVEGKLIAELTADNLAIGDAFYDFQLRAERGAQTMHTNVVSAYVPDTISGDGNWPMTPSEFLQAEARLRDINAHPPIPGEDGEHWALWSYEQQEYVLSDFPLPEGAGGSFNIHSLPAEDELTDADELPFYDESARGQRKTTWQNIKAKLKAYFDNLYIKATELQTAINTALAQAKESGEFDGEQGPAGPPGRDGSDGRDGVDGQNGITPHIGANGNWYIGNTDTGLPSRGEDGADGTKWHTGIDYPVTTQIGDLWLYTGSITAHPDGYRLGDISQYDGMNWTIVSNIRGAIGQNGADGTKWYVVGDPYVQEGQTGDLALCMAYSEPFVPYDILQWQNNMVGWQKVGNIKGTSGTDGHTPIKGTDYWTAADKQGIVDDVLAALPTWQGGSY